MSARSSVAVFDLYVVPGYLQLLQDRSCVKSPRTWAALICSCVATRRWEGTIREGGERGCHVELTENCTTPQRKITPGTNARLVRLSFSLLLSSSFLVTSSLSLSPSDISQNPFCSPGVVFHIPSLSYLLNVYLPAYFTGLNPLGKAKTRGQINRKFPRGWRPDLSSAPPVSPPLHDPISPVFWVR